MAILSRGERFKEARLTYNQHNKQTMKEVETATGVSASIIQALEDDANTRSVGYDKVARLAKHYGVTSDWLLGLSDAKTTDKDIRIAMQHTGLTEENISFLDDPSSIFGNDEPLNDFRKSLYTLVNDLIFLCKDPDVYIPFWQIQRILSIIGDTEIPAPGSGFNNLIAEGIAKKQGYAVLSVNDSIAFYAAQMAKAIEAVITERYSVTEKNIPSGGSETISVNGKEITVYKE